MPPIDATLFRFRFSIWYFRLIWCFSVFIYWYLDYFFLFIRCHDNIDIACFFAMPAMIIATLISFFRHCFRHYAAFLLMLIWLIRRRRYFDISLIFFLIFFTSPDFRRFALRAIDFVRLVTLLPIFSSSLIISPLDVAYFTLRFSMLIFAALLLYFRRRHWLFSSIIFARCRMMPWFSLIFTPFSFRHFLLSFIFAISWYAAFIFAFR